MDKGVLDLLNIQIEKEAHASQVYLGLSISIDFKGYADLDRDWETPLSIHC